MPTDRSTPESSHGTTEKTFNPNMRNPPIVGCLTHYLTHIMLATSSSPLRLYFLSVNTNDAFVGIDSVELMTTSSSKLYPPAYDAGKRQIDACRNRSMAPRATIKVTLVV